MKKDMMLPLEMPLVEQIWGAHHLSNRILTLPRMLDGEVFPPLWIVWDYYELAQGFTPHLYTPHSISAMIKQSTDMALTQALYLENF